MNFKEHTIIDIERGGKKKQRYVLIRKFEGSIYFAVKANGGERPRKVYLIDVQEEEFRGFNDADHRKLNRGGA